MVINDRKCPNLPKITKFSWFSRPSALGPTCWPWALWSPGPIIFSNTVFNFLPVYVIKCSCPALVKQNLEFSTHKYSHSRQKTDRKIRVLEVERQIPRVVRQVLRMDIRVLRLDKPVLWVVKRVLRVVKRVLRVTSQIVQVLRVTRRVLRWKLPCTKSSLM